MPDGSTSENKKQELLAANKTSWYTDDVILSLIEEENKKTKSNTTKSNTIEVLAPVLMGDKNNSDDDPSYLKGLLTGVKGMYKNKNLLIPLNIGKSHWTLLYLEFEGDKSVPTAYYFDSMGTKESIKPDSGRGQKIVDILKKVYGKTDIAITPMMMKEGALQSDGYNCGTWIVEAAKAIIANEAATTDKKGTKELSLDVIVKDIGGKRTEQLRALSENDLRKLQYGIISEKEPEPKTKLEAEKKTETKTEAGKETEKEKEKEKVNRVTRRKIFAEGFWPTSTAQSSVSMTGSSGEEIKEEAVEACKIQMKTLLNCKNVFYRKEEGDFEMRILPNSKIIDMENREANEKNQWNPELFKEGGCRGVEYTSKDNKLTSHAKQDQLLETALIAVKAAVELGYKTITVRTKGKAPEEIFAGMIAVQYYNAGAAEGNKIHLKTDDGKKQLDNNDIKALNAFLKDQIVDGEQVFKDVSFKLDNDKLTYKVDDKDVGIDNTYTAVSEMLGKKMLGKEMHPSRNVGLGM